MARKGRLEKVHARPSLPRCDKSRTHTKAGNSSLETVVNQFGLHDTCLWPLTAVKCMSHNHLFLRTANKKFSWMALLGGKRGNAQHLHLEAFQLHWSLMKRYTVYNRLLNSIKSTRQQKGECENLFCDENEISAVISLEITRRDKKRQVYHALRWPY